MHIYSGWDRRTEATPAPSSEILPTLPTNHELSKLKLGVYNLRKKNTSCVRSLNWGNLGVGGKRAAKRMQMVVIVTIECAPGYVKEST